MPTLIDRITPTIVSAVQSDKEAIVAASGSIVNRALLRAAWPLAVAVLPIVLRKAYDALLDEIGHRSIADVTRELLDDYQSMVKARNEAAR